MTIITLENKRTIRKHRGVESSKLCSWPHMDFEGRFQGWTESEILRYAVWMFCDFLRGKMWTNTTLCLQRTNDRPNKLFYRGLAWWPKEFIVISHYVRFLGFLLSRKNCPSSKKTVYTHFKDKTPIDHRLFFKESR